MCAKMNMVGSAYFLAYFETSMPQPVSPLSIYQEWYGKNFFQVNPLVTKYPWEPILDPDTKTPVPLPNGTYLEISTKFPRIFCWLPLAYVNTWRISLSKRSKQCIQV